ncbi:coiled-coil domain-containing protein 186-like [Harmonia axyridis]|uniref:coiled-coil domain-containing protein 186-like n=1 Tax=Harmonia axyridis TaxID=115357 RepID=UPI001E279B27|nr:coiled-coil domain-containing protein 186-like [Harmonia axyridis]
MENDTCFFLNSHDSSEYGNVKLQKNEEKMIRNKIYSNSLEKELDLKIGLNHDESIEKYRQLVYEYFLKAEDLESKCTMLHRNLQEVKEAWDKAKMLRDHALKEKEEMTLKFAKGERKMLNEKDLKEKAEKKCNILTKEIEALHRKLQMQVEEKARISNMYDNKVHELKDAKSENDRILNENFIMKNELKLCQIALKNQSELNETFRQCQAKLKEVELEKNEKEQQLESIYKTLDDLSSKHQVLLMENNVFSDRIQKLETKIFNYEDELGKSVSNKNEENISHLCSLDQLKLKNQELEIDYHSCQMRETETLVFNKQLSEKNAILQSENSNYQSIIYGLKVERNELKKSCKELKADLKTLSERLVDEKQEKMKILAELEALKKNLAEQTRQNLNLKQQLFDQQEDISIMRKKHNYSLRELRKEMMIHKYNNDDNRSSKSSSTMSLHSSTSRVSEPSYDQVEVIQPENVLNQNVLIERILRLQKIIVRKSEKIDFLEDQLDILFYQLHKRRKLLQYYFLQERTETLTSKEMDESKLKLIKLGGVMASVFDARVSDKNLTLELSLEINSKLQAVLEDVLLKNIILKENIEMLGKEIDRLNRRFQNR